MRSAVLSLVVACALACGGCKVKSGGKPCPDGQCKPVVQETTYTPVPLAEVPVMNLPVASRMRNYNSGSCVCASTISCLRWQGQDDLAKKMREICSGGQSAGSLHEKLERLGIRYAYTTSGDVKFLEWAIRTRRGSGITFFSNHFINIVHMDATHVLMMDNNHPQDFIKLDRDEFIRRWHGYGGWATVPVYSPAPPLAYKSLATID